MPTRAREGIAPHGCVSIAGVPAVGTVEFCPRKQSVARGAYGMKRPLYPAYCLYHSLHTVCGETMSQNSMTVLLDFIDDMGLAY